MKPVSTGPLAEAARSGGYAVPAFNTNGATYDITRAALESAQEARSPMILQVYEPNTDYRGYDYFVQQVRFLCDDLGITVPIAIHLDHGHSLESVMRAIRAGFTSVMIDASHSSLEENAEISQRVIELARPLGVSVEAEIGYVTGNEAPPGPQVGRTPIPERPVKAGARTQPEEALVFLEKAKVDLLAVAVGTTHGVYQSQTDIDFSLLKELRRVVPVPLVQHGTGGIALQDLGRIREAGMAKVNFGEVFRYAYIDHFMDAADTEEHHWHPWRIMQEVKHRLKTQMLEIIHVLGAEGRA